MVPTSFVLLDRLPLTAHGKIDRRALPAPDQRRDRDYQAPRDPLEQQLADLWAGILGLEKVGIFDDFLELGGDSLLGAVVVNQLYERLGEAVYVSALFEAPTVAELAEYLRQHYPGAPAKICGEADGAGKPETVPGEQVDGADAARLRGLIPPPAPGVPGAEAAPKNPPAIFVLAPPRSGSSLFRIMLGGNPRLFAPPELELLAFDSLAPRRSAFSDQFSFMREGAIRALMEIESCTADRAEEIMARCEERDLSISEFYRFLQDQIGDRILVDKTTSYPFHVEVMERAERLFDGALYLHLVRHPGGMVHSFREARIDRLVRFQHAFSARQLGELLWLISHQNTERFLATVPEERRHRVVFEELLARPEAVLGGICRFLGLEYHPDMADPYRHRGRRMTDGIHAGSIGLTDFKFHRHKKLDPAVADSWRQRFDVASLSDASRRLARTLGYDDIPPPATAPAIPKAAAADAYPLSFAQQRLWFLDRLYPDQAGYNVALAHRLRGELDQAILERSLDALVRRHEPLRTAFRASGGVPRQVILDPAPARLPLVDLTDRPAAQRETAARRLAVEELRGRFDLAAGAPIRARLLRLGDRDHVLLLTMHHIVSDGWSLGVLYRELATLYTSFARGEESPLAPLPIQYVDFAVSQRKWLGGGEGEKQLGYWKTQLAGLSTLELPVDRPRPTERTFAASSERLAFPNRLAEAVDAFSRRLSATPFMALLAAFMLLLRRHSDQDDIAVGSPIANRNRLEIEPLIGFFVNTLVMRLDLSGRPTFRELVSRVRNCALGAYAHQDLPFERLVEELHPERDPGRNPLFQVSFTVRNAESEQLKLPGVEVEPFDRGAITTHFDLGLHMIEVDGGMEALFIYDTDLFDATRIGRMAKHYRNLLRGAVAGTDLVADSLPMLSDQERHQLLVEWNDTEATYPGVVGIHELLAQQMACTPDTVAVSFGSRAVTYGELGIQAERLARMLRTAGVGPDVPVGVCCERSIEMMVGILGTLMAGGAYLPLDPSLPARRLAFMLADAAPPVLLVRDQDVPRLPGYSGCVIRLDSIVGRPAVDRAEKPLEPAGRPENLAYVLYTSGSTGTPKGVMVSHRALCNFMFWKQRAFPLTAIDRVVQKTAFSFDASVWELFAPLMVGAELILAPSDAHRDADLLIETMQSARATILKLVPSLLRVLVAHPAFGSCSSLRHVMCGGEPLTKNLADRCAARLKATVHNLYGPTETTIDVTSWTCRPGHEAPGVPIGRPVDNVSARILAPDGSLVPPGVPGELSIGGIQLARGYLRRPGLTAERFVPDPNSDAGGRLYRTGDLVRLRAGGAIEFLGRLDHQVKLRGFRIELGEIEAILSGHDAVRDAVVLCHEDALGEILVAYATRSDAGGEVVSTSLRTWLAERLPSYMVPTALVLLDELPLNPSGKVDRRALAALEADRQRQSEDYVEPHSEIERRIADIWRQVLDLEKIGIRDNFFDLGGHSLLLLEVQAKLLERLGREVRATVLFQYPTIETLAAHLQPGRAARHAIDAESTGQIRALTKARAGALAATGNTSVAIVAMAGRFPQAPDLATFWSRLCAGVESIRFFTDEELRRQGVAEDRLADPRFVKAFGMLEDIDLFDARFFGYTPREAEITDPQQRIFLECASEALERAGYDPERYPGRIGVYAGASKSTYEAILASHPELLESVGRMQLKQATGKDYLATRVSYKLGLRGPSVSIQTACSTSLVAVHEACRSLLDDQCDLALAGGVSVRVPQKQGYFYEKGGVRSPDGHCRPFDARAQGALGGSGAGIVVLKRLDEALADGDRIHAVIRGTAINNDGAARVGFTAPGVQGQAEVIAAAQAVAGVGAETIGYVEAHGTGTPLGDPIEIEALSATFREHTEERGVCAIGSLKSNIGHLDAAAGVAGLIKTALALEHRQIPPSLHFETPNPQIDFDSSPFYVSTECHDWARRNSHPRRAAVSSFGIGGTNAHAVLEEAPAQVSEDPAPTPPREWQLLVLSAKDAPALERQTANLAAYLSRGLSEAETGTQGRSHEALAVVESRGRAEARTADSVLGNVAFTLQVGRRQFAHRRAVVCRDADGAVAALEGKVPAAVTTRQAGAGKQPVAFLFPGQGAQYVNMGRGLYQTEPVFRQTVDECLAFLVSEMDFDLRAVLYPGEVTEAAAQRLEDTAVAQPALFVVEYALAALWRSWGIEPAACIGHSIGEFVAAVVSGVLEWPDALRLVTHRGRLMAQQPRGAMLAVPLAEDELRGRLNGADGLWLSAVNAPSLCAVSGAESSVGALERQLAGQGLECRRLHTSHAFHSGMMEAAVAPFVEAVRAVDLGEPRIPYVSNVTGTWITAAEVRDPAYWGRHIRQAVRFSDGLELLLADDRQVLLEVGPGQVLSSLARQQPRWHQQRLAVRSLRRPGEQAPDAAFLLGAVGRLWTGGVVVSWDKLHDGEARRRVELPTYPFERRRFLIERAPAAAARPRALGRLPSIDDWFAFPAWRLAALPSPAAAGAWLVIGADTGEGEAARRALAGAGAEVEAVPSDEVPTHLAPRIVLSGGGADGGRSALLCLARRLAELSGSVEHEIVIVCSGLHAVTADEIRDPRAAALDAMARVMAQELPGVRCRTVDLCGEVSERRLAAELSAGEPTAALRTGRRWLLSYQPVTVVAAAAKRLATDGKVYLITGGLGRIGLALAESLAADARVTLVLSSRTPLESDDPRTRRLRAIEDLGATVATMPADVGDPAQVARLIREIDARCGRLDGVIHAAGVTGARCAVSKLDASACEAQLAAKQRGLAALDEALRGRALDFRVATSSISTIIGGLEMAAYAAANAAMDAVAAGSPDGWLTIALDGWAFETDGTVSARSAAMRLAMTPEEGVEATRRAIAADLGFRHLVVSTADFEARIERWVTAPARAEPPRLARERPPAVAGVAEAPPVADPPETPLQHEIADLWQLLLGVERVGIHDDFFDLGGHSLLAMRLLASLEQAFGVELPVRVIFEAPTVLALEAEITRRLAEDQDEAELAQMISEVEGLSDEELKALLEERPS